jgi:hypothetical protein
MRDNCWRERRKKFNLNRTSLRRAFRCLCTHWRSNEYRWTCEGSVFDGSHCRCRAGPLIPIYASYCCCSLVCCRRDETTFTDDCKYRSPLEARRMPNPYRWCRMPISKLMVNRPRVGMKKSSETGTGRAKSFRIVFDFTIIVDLLWITKKWPSLPDKISHFVNCFNCFCLLPMLLAISDEDACRDA